MTNFTVLMLDELLRSVGAPPAEPDSETNWLTKANEPRADRSWCWVCHKKRPNLTCQKCIGTPILCLDCAGDYHNDHPCYRAYKSRRRNAADDEDEEELDHNLNEADAMRVVQNLMEAAILDEMGEKLNRDCETDMNMQEI